MSPKILYMKRFFTESEERLNAFYKLLNNPGKFVITSHQNPDGDAFGSSLGLYFFLKSFDIHKITVISPTDHTDFLGWMPGVKDVLNFESSAKEQARQLISEADAIFCLDFSSLGRLKDMEEPVRNSSAVKVLIDHHQEPDQFADFVFWNELASSTCELVYQLIEALDLTGKISLDAANCLYTGILTDTGSFKFDSTGPEVHRIAGELLRKGVRPNKINRDLFDTNSFDRLKLLGYVLSKKMVYLPEYRVAYMKISESELKQYNSKNGETEGIVNYGLSIKDAVMSVIFIEKDQMIKISFRSVDEFSVSQLARDHFSGGGHHNAAGGKSDLNLEETEQKFLNLLPFYKNQLLSQPKS